MNKPGDLPEVLKAKHAAMWASGRRPHTGDGPITSRDLFGDRVTDLVARQQMLPVDRFTSGREFRDS